MKSRSIKAIVFFLVAAFLASGCGLGAIPLQTPTPTETSTPTATFTATDIPSDTPTATSTPIPSVVTAHWEPLFAGPASSFPFTDLDSGVRLYILTKKNAPNPFGCNIWYKVQVENTDRIGWIECGSMLTSEFDDSTIPVDQGEPLPTPTPAPTPVLPRTVHITLVNGTIYDVQADFYGPYEVHVSVPAGVTTVVALPAGYYQYYLSHPGILSTGGQGDWKEGYEDTLHITVK